MSIVIQPTDAILVIDVLNDFIRGKLAVRDGAAVVPVANKVIPLFANSTYVLIQDWHGPGHISFDQWGPHAEQGYWGSEFDPDLLTDPADAIIRKGTKRGMDSYSGFFENDKTTPTGLSGFLFTRKVNRVFSLGLALDFCVGWTAIDAAKAGFESYVIEDGCRALDINGSRAKTLADFAAHGVKMVTSDQLSFPAAKAAA
jgi:nicotinamidase/pyrazinamidase